MTEKELIIGTIIIVLLLVLSWEYQRSGIESDDIGSVHVRGRGEMEWDNLIERYGGYENYRKHELIVGCLDGCNAPEEDCGYCYENR